MKTLMLLRHGKSDWHHDLSDHDRPLAARGIDAAQRVGRFLASLDQVPQQVISSSATRAKETIEIAAQSGDWKRTIEFEPRLYDTNAQAVFTWLQERSDEIQSLLLVGHQPTWGQLTSALIGGGHLRFPTAGLVRIDLQIDRWEQIEFGCGELVWFELPRTLKGIGWPVDS